MVDARRYERFITDLIMYFDIIALEPCKTENQRS